MLDKLTKEQEDLIPVVRQEWLDVFFKNKGNINKKIFEEQIEWLYKRLNYEKPFIWYCDSPIMVQIIINILRKHTNIWANVGANIMANVGANVWANIRANIRANIGANIRANIRANIMANVGANVGANVWANIRANIRANIMANVGANVGANVWANIRANVGANIRANVWANIRDNIGANVGDNIRDNIGFDYEPFTNYGNYSDFGWVSFYDYFRRLNYFEFNWDDFINFKELLKSGIYDFVAFEKILFASSSPAEIHRDNNNRLHSTTKPSVFFKDGYALYAIHGRILPEWIWKEKNKITKKQFLEESNAEIRAAIYTILGEKRIMEVLGAKEIDKQLVQHANDEVEIIKLYKTTETFSEINNESFAWVKFICPSTGTEYIIACEPKFDNAKEAAASLSIFKTNEYSFNFRT